MIMERKQEENGKLCSFFEKPVSDGLIDQRPRDCLIRRVPKGPFHK